MLWLGSQHAVRVNGVSFEFNVFLREKFCTTFLMYIDKAARNPQSTTKRLSHYARDTSCAYCCGRLGSGARQISEGIQLDSRSRWRQNSDGEHRAAGRNLFAQGLLQLCEYCIHHDSKATLGMFPVLWVPVTTHCEPLGFPVPPLLCAE